MNDPKKIKAWRGISGFNTKSLRHTFATRALEMGISIRDLQRYLDHSDTRITEIYAHDLDRKDLEIDIGI
jgi:integrase